MFGFETPEHERRLWDSLKRRQRMPHKFAYTGRAALTHNTLVRESGYQSVVGEGSFEAGFLAQYLVSSTTQSDQFCDVGPGNGYHSSVFLKSLASKGFLAEHYLGLDFSEFLLAIAEARLTSSLPEIRYNFDTWDIEAGPTQAIAEWRHPGCPVVATVLGHTVGNLESPGRGLRNLRQSCAAGDLIVISVAMLGGQDPSSILKQYSNQSFQRAAIEPLRMAGLDLSTGSLQMSFSEIDCSVLGKFVFDEPCCVEYAGDILRFSSGDAVDCFVSRRFTLASFAEIMRESGLRTLCATVDPPETHGIWVTSVN